MEILITKADSSTEDILVDFKTPYGEGKAFWNGVKVFNPEENQKYKVEFDISDPLVWGKEIHLSERNTFHLSATDEGVQLTGRLEEVDEDDIAILKFGESIIQLEVEGKKLPIGKFVDISTGFLEIYEIAY
ncbi:hypothetical protein [Alkaliphilus transvaalensis]|uniref:hypothetical protein n=1 Tax=Alkaliphilus transvaalensis TaxID=114628 RepID=UPI00047C00E5|nr:hypothetical protein [Alkaliphilus transvaalensis]